MNINNQNIFFISYDLVGEESRVYDTLINFLEEKGATKLQKSLWRYKPKTDTSCRQLIDELQPLFEDKDRLVVIESNNFEEKKTTEPLSNTVQEANSKPRNMEDLKRVIKKVQSKLNKT